VHVIFASLPTPTLNDLLTFRITMPIGSAVSEQPANRWKNTFLCSLSTHPCVATDRQLSEC
jgi:hypothetical protein